MSSENYKWTTVGKLFITVATSGNIERATWRQFIDDMRASEATAYLSVGMGTPQVDSVQRKEAAELLKERNIAVAVVTDDKVVRGVVTAVSWLGVNIKSFPISKIRQALEHLNVPESDFSRITASVDEISNSMIS
jgi:hypothetical protein